MSFRIRTRNVTYFTLTAWLWNVLHAGRNDHTVYSRRIEMLIDLQQTREQWISLRRSIWSVTVRLIFSILLIVKFVASRLLKTTDWPALFKYFLSTAFRVDELRETMFIKFNVHACHILDVSLEVRLRLGTAMSCIVHRRNADGATPNVQLATNRYFSSSATSLGTRQFKCCSKRHELRAMCQRKFDVAYTDPAVLWRSRSGTEKGRGVERGIGVCHRVCLFRRPCDCKLTDARDIRQRHPTELESFTFRRLDAW